MKYIIALSVLLLAAYSGFLLSGESPKLINSDIKEASGIVYHTARNTLFVVDDDGILFELDLDGAIVRQKYMGDFDLEGVTVGVDGKLILAVEGRDMLFFVDVSTLAITKKAVINRNWQGMNILKEDASHGIEGIHAFRGNIFMVNQSYNLDPGKNPEDPSMIFQVRENTRTGRFDIFSVTYFPFPDLAGIAERDGLLYIVSDDQDLILIYDPQTNEILDYYDHPVSGDQEGITFDANGTMYSAVEYKGVFKTEFIIKLKKREV